MSTRHEKLPPDEKCCALQLAGELCQIQTRFAIHCQQHGIEPDRAGTIIVEELLAHAAVIYDRLMRGAGYGPPDPERFASAALGGWYDGQKIRDELAAMAGTRQ